MAASGPTRGPARSRSGEPDDDEMSCGPARYYELHGLDYELSTTSLGAVLPEHTSPVHVSFKDGSSTELHANANGVITHKFTKPARLVSYTGPTGLRIRLIGCTTHDSSPCLTSGNPAAN